jgi:Bacterial antitoxin of type II TA system, VapB
MVPSLSICINGIDIYAFHMHTTPMRTTLNLDAQLIEEARALSGILEKTALIHAGLEALIRERSRERLKRLAGSEPQLRPAPRRRGPE